MNGALRKLLGIGMLVALATAQAIAADSKTVSNHGRLQQIDCWEIHSLGTFGGSMSVARRVNDSGQVTGIATTEPRIRDEADPPVEFSWPFISAPNGGALTHIPVEGYFGGDPTALNNIGQVAGDTTIGRSFPTAFITDAGGTPVRTTLSYADVPDMNNVGQTLWALWYPNFHTVIGRNEQSNTNGSSDIDVLEVTVPVADPWNAFVGGVALNDYGQVAVNANDEGYPWARTTAYRWSAAEGAIKLAPNSQYSRAVDMNNLGQVVGVLTNDGVDQAFVTHRYSLSLTVLGEPGDGNVPTAINNYSQIVGTTGATGAKHAYVTVPFLMHQSINLSNLSEVTRAGWTDLQPTDINNRGQIAGTGKMNGDTRAFLLTPLSILAYLPDRNGEPAQCFNWQKP